MCSLVITFAFALSQKGAQVPEEHCLRGSLSDGGINETVAEDVRAWSPFILIFVVLHS